MQQLKAAQALSRRMEMTSRWVSSARIAEIWDGSFQACWQQSQEEVIVGEGKPIPGHPKAVPAHKSPRAKSPRSPGGALDFSKSPRSPGAECSKSPISDIVGLPDEDLRKLKISLLSSSPEKWVVTYEFLISYSKFIFLIELTSICREVSVVQARKTQIKFSDEDYVTINPDDQTGGPKI